MRRSSASGRVRPNYYVGQHFLTQGRQQEAVEMFRAALATGSSRLDEYGGAQAELQRLGY
jgi:hypothetical protein